MWKSENENITERERLLKLEKWKWQWLGKTQLEGQCQWRQWETKMPAKKKATWEGFERIICLTAEWELQMCSRFPALSFAFYKTNTSISWVRQSSGKVVGGEDKLFKRLHNQRDGKRETGKKLIARQCWHSEGG